MITRPLVPIIGFAVLACATLPASALAASSRSPEGEERVAQCIRLAAGGRGWLEKTLWGLRDKEGGWLGAEVLNSNGSHDLGPLQVNSFWVPRLAALTGKPASQVRNWLTNDACFNVQAARWIFLSGLSITRDYWKAVGVYHSPTGWRQRRYIESVSQHLERRFGRDVFSANRGSPNR